MKRSIMYVHGLWCICKANTLNELWFFPIFFCVPSLNSNTTNDNGQLHCCLIERALFVDDPMK